MDEIFQEARGLRGALDVVKIAKQKPQRYDKHGKLLINYDDTEFAHRRHSTAKGTGGGGGSAQDNYQEKSEDTNGSEERREAV